MSHKLKFSQLLFLYERLGKKESLSREEIKAYNFLGIFIPLHKSFADGGGWAKLDEIDYQTIKDLL